MTLKLYVCTLSMLSMPRNTSSHASVRGQEEKADRMVSLKVIADRWQVDRSTARRILRQAGIRPIILGTGRNGSIRYVVKEIEAWVSTRMRAI